MHLKLLYPRHFVNLVKSEGFSAEPAYSKFTLWIDFPGKLLYYIPVNDKTQEPGALGDHSRL